MPEDVITPHLEDGSHEIPDILELMYTVMRQRGRDQRVELRDVFDALMRQRMDGRNPNSVVRGRSDLDPEQGWSALGSGPYMIYGFPGLFISNGSPRSGPRHADFGDYFMGPGLEELIEQLTMNDRRGPPPAPTSSIDAMPTIRITQAHLRTDSHCPVCKEKFELDSEARQMPCNHIYHSDCIIPWLVQHNSCPVCRLELPSQGIGGGRDSHSRGGGNNGSGSSSSSSGNDGGSSGSRENSRQNQGRRNPWSNIWPFRSSNSNTRHHAESRGSHSSAAQEHNDGMNFSDWPVD